jgi:hypothetical protein
MGLDILQIMLMSCPTPCMVLSWAFGNLGSMGTNIGNEHIVLFRIYTCMKQHIHNGHPLRHGNIEGAMDQAKKLSCCMPFYVTWPNPYLLLCYHALMGDHYGCVIPYMYKYGIKLYICSQYLFPLTPGY